MERNNGNYSFKEDLIIGEAGEKTIIEDLQSMGATFVSDNKTNTHDILMMYKDKKITYECKADTYIDTGNMFIEVECRGKESGIMVTKAEWFVMYFKRLNQAWYIKTDRLKAIINNFPHRISRQSGDAGSNTVGYLINKTKFRDDFIVRNPLTHEKL